MNNQMINEAVFKHPFTCLITGPSKSGKSTLLNEILQLNQRLIDKNIDQIIYCYTRFQDSYKYALANVFPRVEFKQGLPDMEDFDSSKNNLLIVDDLMAEACNDHTIFDIFTIDSHHKNIRVFFLTQNIFPRDKNARSISLNTNYIIIMNNPRDKHQVSHLGRQMFPENSKYFLEAFKDAVENVHYGHLLVDLTQTTDNKHRLQSNITKINRIFYVENN